MFYNRFTGRWVFDPIDCLLLSAYLGSASAKCLKNYLSEESKMKLEQKAMQRLKEDIILQSPELLEHPELFNSAFTSDTSDEFKARRVYQLAASNSALSLRGGQIENVPGSEQLAVKLRDLFVAVARFLHEKQLTTSALYLVYKNANLLLDLAFRFCKINVKYHIVSNDPINPVVIIATTTTGGLTGFILSWYSVTGLIFTPALFLATFISRSVFQQYQNLKDFFDFREAIQQAYKEFQLKVMEEFLNSNMIAPGNLDWNNNPDIRANARNLGVFQKAPDGRGPLKYMDEEFLSTVGIDINEMKQQTGEKVAAALSHAAEHVDKIIDVEIIDTNAVETSIKIKNSL